MPTTSKRTDLDFEEFRKLLEEERTRLMTLHHRQRNDMEAESRDTFETELSHTDWNEPGDSAASLADHDRDQAQDVELMATVHEIDKAIDRIANGTYGLDVGTGQTIPVERLRAIPWASMTVQSAENA